jgi:ketosteroid isomerase-like protein
MSTEKETSMQLTPYILSALGFLVIAGTNAVVAADTDVSKCPVNKQWQTAYNKGDADAVVALYAPDAIEVTPEGIKVGLASIKERVEGSIKQLKNADIVATKCDVDGDFRWSSGTWKAESSQGPAGGFWTALETKHGDAWKMRNLTYNLTPPPATK